MRNSSLITLVCLLSLSGPWACSVRDEEGDSGDTKIKVMLLGVYHFDNPGLDKHNLEIDDYFSGKRHEEIGEVVRLLSAFSPDKIFIEQKPSSQRRIDSLYEAFTGNILNLKDLPGGRNEIYQVGFTLAKEVNLKTLHCIDAPGNWLGPYADFIADTLSLSYYKEDEENSMAAMESLNADFRARTVRENLVHTNQWNNILDNHRYYIDVAMRVKDTVGIYFRSQDTTLTIDEKEYLMRSFDFDNIGVELVAEWYKRNFFIYRNILEQAAQGDTILIMFGQGHIPILHHLLENNARFEIVTPLEYL